MPTEMRSSVITCLLGGGATFYPVTFSSTFTATPLLALGINSMQITPGLSVDFNSAPGALTTAGSLVTGFTIVIGWTASTSLSSLTFYYLAIHPTFYSFEGGKSPFLVLSIYDNALATVNSGTGFRSYSKTIARPGGSGAFEPSHYFSCAAMLLGFQGSTIDNYTIEYECYLTDTSYIYVINVFGNTLVTAVTIGYFAVDVFALEYYNTMLVETWDLTFINGTSTSFVPSYPSTNLAILFGIKKLTL
jgi:hypothetical protein